MKTLQIEIDDEILNSLEKSPREFENEIRLAAAVKLYEMGTLSQSEAAQLAGLTLENFISELSNYKSSPVQINEEVKLPITEIAPIVKELSGIISLDEDDIILELADKYFGEKYGIDLDLPERKSKRQTIDFHDIS